MVDKPMKNSLVHVEQNNKETNTMSAQASRLYPGSSAQHAVAKEIIHDDGSIPPKYVSVVWDPTNTLSNANISLSSNNGTYAIATLGELGRHKFVSIDHVVYEAGLTTVDDELVSISVLTIDPAGTIGSAVNESELVAKDLVARWPVGSSAREFVHIGRSGVGSIAVAIESHGDGVTTTTISGGKFEIVLRLDADSTDMKNQGLSTFSMVTA